MSLTSPDDILKTFNKALQYLMSGQLDQAKEGFETVIANNPNSPEANLNLGNVFFMQNNIDQAIIYFEKAVKLDPTLRKGYINLGSCYFKKDKIIDAIGFWSIAANLEPQNSMIHMNLGVAYEKIASYQKAFKHYEQFLLCNGKWDNNAMKIKCKVEESKRIAFHNLNAGITFQKRNKLNEAALAYKKSIEAYPNFSKAHLNLGSIFFKKNMIEDAINYWENALKLETEHANTHCNLAIAYDKKQIYDEACYHYIKYLDITNGKTNDAPQVKERIDQLHKILADKRELIRQHVNKANNLFSERRYEDAIEEYTKYIVLNQQTSENKAIQEKIKEAKIRLNPVEKALEVAYQMGNEYMEKSLYDKAIAAYNRYLNLNPQAPKAKEVKQKIETCQKYIANVVSAMLQAK